MYIYLGLLDMTNKEFEQCFEMKQRFNYERKNPTLNEKLSNLLSLFFPRESVPSEFDKKINIGMPTEYEQLEMSEDLWR